jgi:hypothetical protein
MLMERRRQAGGAARDGSAREAGQHAGQRQGAVDPQARRERVRRLMALLDQGARDQDGHDR